MKEAALIGLKRLVYTLILLAFYPAVKLLFDLEVEGRRNIPDDTDDILITASHTSYWDPPFIGLTFGPVRQVHFIAREGLLRNPLFKYPVMWFSTTINRDNFGKSDLKKMLTAFREKGLLCIFPEGTTSETSTPKSGTVRLAEKSGRRFLPLKIEIERSPLTYPFLFAPARLRIGEPLDLEELRSATRETRKRGSGETGDADYRELSLRLMEIIDSL